MVGGVRVGVAFNDVTLEPDPTWTYLTDEPNLVASFSIDRGRSFEMDQTDAGRATVMVNDVDGLLDPTNTGSPYYGLLEPLLQIILDLYDPYAETWTTIYRGYIEEFDYSVHPSQQVTQMTISCVDAFEILGAIEMQPDNVTTFGDPPPVAVRGDIFFDNADEVRVRMFQVLGNANWPPELATIFSGNVSLLESTYSPGETVLTVLQDAADAEFPGIGNLYVAGNGTAAGTVTFHGRRAKFNPVEVAAQAELQGEGRWDFHVWKAGDGAAILASPSDTAQLREFSFNRGLSKIINFASASPASIKDTDMAGQTVQDAASIAQYGYRTWSKPNLQTEHGWLTGNDGNDETKLYAAYYVANYAQPRERITAISFRSLDPSDARAAKNWELLCGAEISDQIDVTISLPGGGGLTSESYYIEGLHYQVNPLQATFADVTLSLDLSPKAYYPASYWGT